MKRIKDTTNTVRQKVVLSGSLGLISAFPAESPFRDSAETEFSISPTGQVGTNFEKIIGKVIKNL